MSCIKVIFLLVNVFVFINSHKSKTYEIPKPEIHIFSPKGFRLCISDAPKINAISLNANINKPIKVGDKGEISQQMYDPAQGKWVFIDENIKLTAGDNVYYTISMVKNGTAYGLDGHYVVKNFKMDPIATHHYHTCGPDTKRNGIFSIFKMGPKHEVTRTGPIAQDIDERFGENSR